MSDLLTTNLSKGRNNIVFYLTRKKEILFPEVHLDGPPYIRTPKQMILLSMLIENPFLRSKWIRGLCVGIKSLMQPNEQHGLVIPTKVLGVLRKYFECANLPSIQALRDILTLASGADYVRADVVRAAICVGDHSLEKQMKVAAQVCQDGHFYLRHMHLPTICIHWDGIADALIDAIEQAARGDTSALKNVAILCTRYRKGYDTERSVKETQIQMKTRATARWLTRQLGRTFSLKRMPTGVSESTTPFGIARDVCDSSKFTVACLQMALGTFKVKAASLRIVPAGSIGSDVADIFLLPDVFVARKKTKDACMFAAAANYTLLDWVQLSHYANLYSVVYLPEISPAKRKVSKSHFMRAVYSIADPEDGAGQVTA